MAFHDYMYMTMIFSNCFPALLFRLKIPRKVFNICRPMTECIVGNHSTFFYYTPYVLWPI